MSFKNYLNIIKSKSLRYIFFRSKYEFERKIGLLRRKFPTKPKEVNLPSLKEWKASSVNYLFNERKQITVSKHPSQELLNKSLKIVSGKILFFNSDWYNLGNNYDWVTNPSTNFKYKKEEHWTKIEDFNTLAGDIKFTWEKSRFSYLYTIIRSDYHNEYDNASFVIGQILDWIDKNPLNCGPNYKCSQEISLRVLNWIFALYFYKRSDVLTDIVWNKIIQSIYWQIHHIYKNIKFSRIAVRNNHAITETLTLYLVCLLFPSFPNSKKWKRDGKRWFEEEIKYQFEPDGSYIQNSFNYQRVVTQLLTLGIALATKNNERFDCIVYERAYANINFLYQLQDNKTGMLPNYGANDGALFFPLSDSDYCDYRPQIDALYSLITGHRLYNQIYEDSEWFGTNYLIDKPSIKKGNGIICFEDSGYFIIRDFNTMTFVRCGSFKGKSGHIDQQMIDIWIDGVNYIMDAGSYKYNTKEEEIRYFTGTESHNTVMIGENDQMLKGPRFMWFYPTTVLSASVEDSKNEYIFRGSVECFKYIGIRIVHKRTIRKKKYNNEWIIEDEILNKPRGMILRQLWHTCSNEIAFESEDKKIETKGYFSRYYGIKNENRQIEISSNNCKITTKINIKS